jgi:DNA-binding transcriptional ArsR family regulator
MSARRRKADRVAPLFAALGDETRLRLVSRLSGGAPVSVTELTTGSGITRQAVSKHLRVLAGAGLVHGTRRGRESLWRLEPRRLDEARRSLEHISRQWDQALDRLRILVEE